MGQIEHVSDAILRAGPDSFGNIYDCYVFPPPALENEWRQEMRETDNLFDFFLSLRATSVRPPTINYKEVSLSYMTWKIKKPSASYDVDNSSLVITFRSDAKWRIYYFFLKWRQLIGRPEFSTDSRDLALAPPLLTRNTISKGLSLAVYSNPTVSGDYLSLIPTQDSRNAEALNRYFNSFRWEFLNVYPVSVEVNGDLTRNARNPMEFNVTFSFLFYNIYPAGTRKSLLLDI